MFKRLVSTLTLLLALLLAPILAAAPAAAQGDDPYVALIAAIESQVDRETLLQRALSTTRDAMLAGNAEVADLEAMYPGVVDRMVTAMTPMIRQHSESMAVLYQQRAAAMIATRLTENEARAAAAFYNSPMGRRLVGAVADNYSFDALAQEVVANPDAPNITTGAIAADLNRSTRDAIADVGAADRAAMERALAGASWVPKLSSLQPQMNRMRAELENAPMEPALEAEMMAAILAVVGEAATGAGGKPQPARAK